MLILALVFASLIVLTLLDTADRRHDAPSDQP